ncbi:DUF1015 domain-containing protein [Gangjinia marincola]|uniref:DUF1015 domain-containing protein n=2 Tax=Gangjinia marincola TaxID=578463 RepID=A0ABP3XQS3_9FLAO
MKANPFSFLHILNPGYKYHKRISGKKRFGLVKNRYEEFKEDGYFFQDQKPCYYVHKIVDRNGQVFCGIIAAASAKDYENDVIKKHEDTIAAREELFKDYLLTVGFNAEAVLLTYPDNANISIIIEKKMGERAEYEFTTTFKDTHLLWVIDQKQDLEAIQHEFEAMDAIYIADGHHRSSSSYLLTQERHKQNDSHTGDEAYNFFMSYIIPESHLKIHEFFRLITDLNGLSKEEFLIALDEHFRIENRETTEYVPSKKHHFNMYLDGEFYSLYLRKAQYTFENALDQLDAQILYKTVLAPILGIQDLRNSDRIDYVEGKKGAAYIKGLVDEKKYAVGFGMLPVTVEELKQVADQGLKMPPKSTYIEPKLRSAITIYEF